MTFPTGSIPIALYFHADALSTGVKVEEPAPWIWAFSVVAGVPKASNTTGLVAQDATKFVRLVNEHGIFEPATTFAPGMVTDEPDTVAGIVAELPSAGALASVQRTPT